MKSDVVNFMASRERQMLDLLKDTVRVQSGTYNKAGVDEVLHLILKAIPSHSLNTRVIRQQDFGDHLLVSTFPCEKRDKQILITGHMDTVFPQDTDFRNCSEDERYIYGPGVIDMKGGVVCGIYALKALDSLGMLNEIPLTFIFNSDEEIGSPTSRQMIEREACRSAFAFVLECGGINGEIVTARKGKVGFTLTTRGQAGHAAFSNPRKASAILALSKKIVALEKLNDSQRGACVNVGTIQGGTTPNTVPDQAEACVDARFDTLENGEKLREWVEEIAGDVSVPGTAGEVQWVSERPPMEATRGNQKLYLVAQRQAKSLGMAVKAEHRSGVSDANVIADQGVPVIDGLGPLGANDHSKAEYMVKDSLRKRTELLVLLILESWRLYRQGKLF
jgi:glutamate carboxypeptidase